MSLNGAPVQNPKNVGGRLYQCGVAYLQQAGSCVIMYLPQSVDET